MATAVAGGGSPRALQWACGSTLALRLQPPRPRGQGGGQPAPGAGPSGRASRRLPRNRPSRPGPPPPCPDGGRSRPPSAERAPSQAGASAVMAAQGFEPARPGDQRLEGLPSGHLGGKGLDSFSAMYGGFATARSSVPLRARGSACHQLPCTSRALPAAPCPNPPSWRKPPPGRPRTRR